MSATLVLALLLATAPATDGGSVSPRLDSVAEAIEARRFDQARLMIARAMASGASGPSIDRLLADLAFASGDDAEALIRYEQVIVSNPSDRLACENGGIAALKLGRWGEALRLINCSTTEGATWRAWNARGALSDLQGNWSSADAAYAQALKLSPDEAAVINNQGWSHLLRGDWALAHDLFARAAALEPTSARISNNLELAQAALGADLPRRRDGESDYSWAGRLNDAGVAAELMGDEQRAIAAFTRAIEASGSWYTRAANNLAAASER